MEQPSSQRNCTSCGAENFQGDLFCRQCGEQLVPSCPQCGTLIDSPARFCHRCGTGLDQHIANAEHTVQDEPEEPGEPAVPQKYDKEQPVRKKGRFGLIAIGAGIILLIVVLAVGILYLLDYFQGTPATTTIPETTVPEQEQPSTPPPSSTELPVIVSFEIDPPKITTAEPTMATWEVTGADMVRIDHDIGEVAHSGSLSLSPVQSTEYRLTASNDAGETTRTAQITVIQSLNAIEMALTSADVSGDGFEFRNETTPAMDNTISTYYVHFNLGYEHMGNLVVVYNTVSEAVKNYYEVKSNHKEDVTDIIDIGDLGYYSTLVQFMPDKTELYTIFFQKDNVYVNVGPISDFDKLQEYARIIESRIP